MANDSLSCNYSQDKIKGQRGMALSKTAGIRATTCDEFEPS